MSYPTAHPQTLAFTPKWRILKVQLITSLVMLALCVLPLLAREFTKHRMSRAELGVSQEAELARLSERVTVRTSGASTPTINLSNGRDVLTSYQGPEESRLALEQNLAKPLSLASADFDEDGVPDLVSGYYYDSRGIVSLFRGNVDTIHPNSPDSRQRQVTGSFTESPFLSPALLFDSPAPPDFIGAGDFNGDGHWDVVTATRGKNSILLMPGDGRGNLGVATAIALPGSVTALVTGEINRADGLTDVVVGINADPWAQVLVFEGPTGAMKAKPESYFLPGPATSLALGQLDGSYEMDLAIGAGQQLMIIHGRDRKLSVASEGQSGVASARVERRTFVADIQSLVIGKFDGYPQSAIAILTADGATQVLSSGSQTPGKARRSQGDQEIGKWQSYLVSSDQSSGPSRLVTARVSTLPGDDLLRLDGSQQRISVLPKLQGNKKVPPQGLIEEAAGSMAMALEVEGGGAVTVMPMQLNTDALTDMVVLRQDQAAPAVIFTSPNATHKTHSEIVTEPAPDRQSLFETGAWTKAANPPSVSPSKKFQTRPNAGATGAAIQPRLKAGAKRSLPLRPLAPCIATPITVGQTVNGSLATTDCFLGDGNLVDAYSFAGTTGQQVAITLDSSAFDAYLYLLKPDGTLLDEDDDGGGGTDARIPTAGGFVSLPTNGTYTIYATSFDSGETGSYTLRLTAPGGGQCPATAIVGGQTLNGTLATTDCTLINAGDRTGAFVDIYTFNGFAGQQVFVAMSSNSFDTYLYAFPPNDLPVLEDDDSGGGTNSRIPPSGTVILPANGPYTIFATSFDDGATGSYAISLGLTNPPPASTVVTNTADSGPGSLRQAIINANANQGVDTISFLIGPGPGARTISPLSALPVITDPVVIDGTTQPGFAGTPIIELDGRLTPQGTPGLEISAGRSRVRGLAINGFGFADCNVPGNVDISVGSGIMLSSEGNNIIEGNYLGTNLAGTAALCNSGNGIFLFNSSDNVIGGTTPAARNLISGNRFPGVGIGGEFSTGNQVKGNYIGTNASGNADLGNRGNGLIVINGTGHIIGGTTAGSGNLISGNDSPGVAIGFSDPSGVLVQGNLIGTNVAGTSALPNQGGGVIVGGFFQLNGEPITATDNTIGGTSPATANLISGNFGNGVEVINRGSQNNLVQGNFIGPNITGTAAIGNFGSGVFITRAPNNFIGGLVGEARNLISGNGLYGVGVGIPRQNNVNPGETITGGDLMFIFLNVIGTNIDLGPMGNGLDGVFVDADSVNNIIRGNIIAFNNGSGVRIPNNGTNPGVQINIDANLIYSNTGIGIDLGPAGVTPNDPGDVDGGANLQQNFPELSPPAITVSELSVDKGKAPNSPTAVTVNGTLMTTAQANRRYTVHWYFSADPQCSNNEASTQPLVFGRVPDVTTDANGRAPFTIPLAFPPGIVSGIVNCTATDEQGNTSEFSLCLPVTDVGTPPATTIQFASANGSVAENGGSATVTVNRLGNNSGVTTVDYATSDSAGLTNCNVVNSPAASSRCDYPTTIGRLRFAAGETSKTISVLIVNDGYDEANEQFNITLSNAVGASLGAPSTAAVTITDNDTVSENPVNQAAFFARQHYLDFFSREPDAAGLAFWTDQITSCGTDTACVEIRRINVSAAFFLSIEFQQTGYLVYRMYKAAYGNIPNAPVPVRSNEFLADTQQIGLGVVVGQQGWEQVLENNKIAFAAEFVARPPFTDAYQANMPAAEFVNRLFANAGVTPTADALQAAITAYGTGDTASRSRVLRLVAENPTLAAQEFNKAFVLMQYLGYLRRNPNDAPDGNFGGFNFWLGKLNQFNGNFVDAEMVKAFILSGEYRQRFGP